MLFPAPGSLWKSLLVPSMLFGPFLALKNDSGIVCEESYGRFPGVLPDSKSSLGKYMRVDICLLGMLPLLKGRGYSQCLRWLSPSKRVPGNHMRKTTWTFFDIFLCSKRRVKKHMRVHICLLHLSFLLKMRAEGSCLRWLSPSKKKPNKRM